MLLPYLLFLSAFQPISQSYTPKHNNVCKHFRDYSFPYNNKNCYYDPDTTLETPELIEKYAGTVERYNVTTEDGYILTMFRIPRKTNKVILFYHPLTSHSLIYLWQGNNSLAMTLWHNGFDVWLANQRGTTYSKGHVNMTDRDFEYWDFSFHETGLYDVSKELEFIHKKTNGSKVIYIGHSLGSTIGLVYTSLKPVEASNYLKSMVLLAAPVYFEHATTPVLIVKRLAPPVKALLDFLRIGSPLRLLPVILPISRPFLRLFPLTLFIVDVLTLVFCGYTPTESDPTFFNYNGAVYADNFSWKIVMHYAQLSYTKSLFQMYDYGRSKNIKVYGQSKPPLYPLEKVSVPTLLVSSFNDTVVSAKDSENLYAKLTPKAQQELWQVEGLNHLDYHLGVDRREIYVNRLVEFLDKL